MREDERDFEREQLMFILYCCLGTRKERGGRSRKALTANAEFHARAYEYMQARDLKQDHTRIAQRAEKFCDSYAIRM